MVLIVALLLLALMALVTFSTYNGTILEERMAGNANNQNIVFQTAELALRSIEMRIDPNWLNEADSCAAFPFGLDKGYYSPANSDLSSIAWDMQANPEPDVKENPNRLFGWKKPTGVSEVRYIVEWLYKNDYPKPNTIHYRITVRTVGDGGKTVVMLQSTYACM
ncbi:pilus assembly PilX family protein [Plasticicumulans lactativorans]|uniref:pilus assembly PilX family protein n=1 Tax=Plasticicumulans lactativorans TaxID=1133106 RepID=UPI0014048904|nr:PilX N-terminal domain-containing pilus assembly protein [Plasticicumulans lactativorans]